MNDNANTSRLTARLHVRSSLGAEATRDIAGALNGLLSDFFALYMKTKNFHWHVSGPQFRDYHLLLDEHRTLGATIMKRCVPGKGAREVAAVFVADTKETELTRLSTE